MVSKNEIRNQIKELLIQQRFAVIATEMHGQPYTNLVAFAATPTLDSIIFATLRTTKKYLNLSENAHIAVLIDNRENTPDDIQHATTVTALGLAYEITTNPKYYTSLLLTRHPNLHEFLASPSCALIRVKVTTYQLVNKFQEVSLLTINHPATNHTTSVKKT